MNSHYQTLILIILILINLILAWIYLDQIYTKPQAVQFGVSYEANYAKYLGLDPKTTYTQMLSDLDIKKIRLNSYWDKIEPKDNQFDFIEPDFYINEASKAGIEIILSVGLKQPRWPECRYPKWLDINSKVQKEEKLLRMVEQTIKHYRDNPSITTFQIENEPLLGFGVCPKPDKNLLKKEVALARSLTDKTILVTDSGELGIWIVPMQQGDIFGTTLYRKVFDKLIGYVTYPIPAWYYKLKAEAIKNLFAPNNQKFIIAEQQAEIWTDKNLSEVPIEQQVESYSLANFKESVEYAQKIGFPESYLWGVEWWYYLASKGHPEYLEYAKELF
jgi:hypothetical protein